MHFYCSNFKNRLTSINDQKIRKKTRVLREKRSKTQFKRKEEVASESEGRAETEEQAAGDRKTLNVNSNLSIVRDFLRKRHNKFEKIGLGRVVSKYDYNQ